MKYFIAYVIKGEAGDYHKRLSDGIARQFNFKPLSIKVPAHLTLKSPFITDISIEEIESLIANFVTSIKAPKLLLESFGSFRDEVIYIDVKPSPNAVAMINDFVGELKNVTWLPFEKFETQEGGAHLHATLAYADTKENFKMINKYLADYNPQFEVLLDNITILKREPEKWVVHKEYSLLSS